MTKLKIKAINLSKTIDLYDVEIYAYKCPIDNSISIDSIGKLSIYDVKQEEKCRYDIDCPKELEIELINILEYEYDTVNEAFIELGLTSNDKEFCRFEQDIKDFTMDIKGSLKRWSQEIIKTSWQITLPN